MDIASVNVDAFQAELDQALELYAAGEAVEAARLMNVYLAKLQAFIDEAERHAARHTAQHAAAEQSPPPPSDPSA